MVDAEGLNVTAEYINTLKTKKAKIAGNVRYEYFKEDDGETEKKKLVMDVELETGEIMQYIPNRTSFKTLCKLFGGKNIDTIWKDKLFQWFIIETMWQGKKTKVLYIDDKDINKIDEIKL